MTEEPSENALVFMNYHPRAKLLSFLFWTPILMVEPLSSVFWITAALITLCLIPIAGLPVSEVVGLIKRMRWLWLGIVFLHGWMTPGLFVWDGFGSPTWQGLQQGGSQAVRLALLTVCAWLLMRSTSVRLLIGVLDIQFLGLGWRRILGLLAFTLEGLPSLLARTRQLREIARLRNQTGRRFSVFGITRMAEAYLLMLMGRMIRQEWALRARGYAEGLPWIPIKQLEWKIGDSFMVLIPLVLWVASLFTDVEVWWRG
ncbi:MAG: hypothetical protein HQL54_08665 [Magnetococcales bacterium]|nr:hypothetical protein [Magnetococcales bacterium]